MNDFKLRLKTERAELEEKLNKLDDFLENERVNDIDPVQASILNIQSSAMYTYLKCLEERLARL